MTMWIEYRRHFTSVMRRKTEEVEEENVCIRTKFLIEINERAFVNRFVESHLKHILQSSKSLLRHGTDCDTGLIDEKINSDNAPPHVRYHLSSQCHHNTKLISLVCMHHNLSICNVCHSHLFRKRVPEQLHSDHIRQSCHSGLELLGSNVLISPALQKHVICRFFSDIGVLHDEGETLVSPCCEYIDSCRNIELDLSVE